MSQDLGSTLKKYADLVVSIGLNLQPGQRLMITAPVDAAPLVRLVTASAYQKGSPLVDVLYNDEQLVLARFQHAPRDSFEEHPVWKSKALEEHFRNGGALLSIYAEDPDLLKEQDPELVGVVMKTRMKYGKPLSELVAGNASNWNLVSMPIPSWSNKVFPDLPPQEQASKLWQAIFETLRLDQDDPLAAWQEHIRQLRARSDQLTLKQYASLHFTGPGTDLMVGLPRGHRWAGGQEETAGGLPFIPNMPTEEVFTMPHKDRVDGVVTASKPLSYAGNMIEDFSLRFKDGLVVEYQAKAGQQVLEKLLETDEGAKRLGEVALVPHSAPTARIGLMFFNTLFDENAASHLALGRAYKFTLQGGQHLSEEDLLAAGANYSLAHEDFMVGSEKIDVDGVFTDGTTEPVMRQGEWAFEV
jgi:aminopeptidase